MATGDSSEMANMAADDVETARYPGLLRFTSDYAQYHGYLSCTICVWAISANLANIVVLTRKHMISPTNNILTWLAVADLLTVLSYLPISIHFHILKEPGMIFPQTTSYSWIAFTLFHVNFTVMTHTMAIWLTVTLGVFRYLYISRPCSGERICNGHRSKVAISVVILSVNIICIPNNLCTTIIQQNKTVSTGDVTNKTDQWDDQVYYDLDDSSLGHGVMLKVNEWLQSILVKLLPCILHVIITILLVNELHKADKRRARLISQGRKDESERAKENNRTTAMLLAIVAFFLVSELPHGILALCNIFIEGFYKDVYHPVGDLLDMLAMINNSINFVLLCTMSRHFRQTFMQMFCRNFRPPGGRYELIHLHIDLTLASPTCRHPLTKETALESGTNTPV